MPSRGRPQTPSRKRRPRKPLRRRAQTPTCLGANAVRHIGILNENLSWRTKHCGYSGADLESPMTALIIEDDPDTQDIVDFALRSEGIRTQRFESFTAALDMAKEACLILADYRVADGMTFEDFIREVRKARPGAPIFMMTAMPDGAKIADQLRIGLLSKPFNLDELLKVAKSYCYANG